MGPYRQAAQASIVAKTERDERAETMSFEPDVRPARGFPEPPPCLRSGDRGAGAWKSFVLKLAPKAEPSSD